jgi:hypothetical protein
MFEIMAKAMEDAGTAVARAARTTGKAASRAAPAHEAPRSVSRPSAQAYEPPIRHVPSAPAPSPHAQHSASARPHATSSPSAKASGAAAKAHGNHGVASPTAANDSIAFRSGALAGGLWKMIDGDILAVAAGMHPTKPLPLPHSPGYDPLQIGLPVDPLADERIYHSDQAKAKHDAEIAADQAAATRRQTAAQSAQSVQRGTAPAERRRIEAARAEATHNATEAATERQQGIDLGLKETLAQVKSRVGYVAIPTALQVTPQQSEAEYNEAKRITEHDKLFEQERVAAAKQRVSGARKAASAAAPQVARRELAATQRQQIAAAKLSAKLTLAAGKVTQSLEGIFRPSAARRSYATLERSTSATQATAIARIRSSAHNGTTVRALERQYVASRTVGAQIALGAATASAQRTVAIDARSLAKARANTGTVALQSNTSNAAAAQATINDNTIAVTHDALVVLSRRTAKEQAIYQRYESQVAGDLVTEERALRAAPSAAARKAIVERTKGIAAKQQSQALQAFKSAKKTANRKLAHLRNADQRIAAKAGYVWYKADPKAESRSGFDQYAAQKSGGQTYAAGDQQTSLVASIFGKGKNVAPVASQIQKVGGTHAKILLVPVSFESGKNLVNTFLLQVKNAHGPGSRFIDYRGYSYSSISDYQHNNDLGGGTLTALRTTSDMQIERDAAGNPAIFAGKAHINPGGLSGFLDSAASVVSSPLTFAAGVFIDVAAPVLDAATDGALTELLPEAEEFGTGLIERAVAGGAAKLAEDSAAKLVSRSLFRLGFAGGTYDGINTLRNLNAHGESLFNGQGIDAAISTLANASGLGGHLVGPLAELVGAGSSKTASVLTKTLATVSGASFGVGLGRQTVQLAQHFSWKGLESLGGSLVMMKAAELAGHGLVRTADASGGRDDTISAESPAAVAAMAHAAPAAKPPESTGPDLGTAHDFGQVVSNDAFSSLAAMSPRLGELFANATAAGWNVDVGERGEGSFTNPNGTITIDPDHLASPELAVATVAEELSHASRFEKPADGRIERPKKLPKERRYVRSKMTEEGRAFLDVAQVRREILKNGGPDISAGNPRLGARLTARAAIVHRLAQSVPGTRIGQLIDIAQAVRIGKRFESIRTSIPPYRPYDRFYGDQFSRINGKALAAASAADGGEPLGELPGPTRATITRAGLGPPSNTPDGVSTVHAFGDDGSIEVFSDLDNALEIRDRRLAHLNLLKERRIRSVDAHAGPDVEGRPTIVYGRRYTNLHEVLNTRTGRIMSPEIVNDRTVADLRAIRGALHDAGIAVDPHLVIDEGGSVFLSTPTFVDTGTVREVKLTNFTQAQWENIHQDIFADRQRAQSASIERFLEVAASKGSRVPLPADLRHGLENLLVSTDYPHPGDYRDARVTEIDGKRVIVVGKGAGQRVVDLHEELGPVEGFGNQKVVLALGDGALGIYNRPMASRALGDVERQLQSELANARFVSRFNLGESPPPQAGPDINGLRTIFFPERFKIGSRQIVIEDDGTVLRPDVLNQGMIDYLTRARETFVAHGLAMDGLEFLFRENGTGIPADFHETYEMGSDSVLLKTRYPLDEEPVPVDTPEDRAKYEHVHADNLRNIDGLLEAAHKIVAARAEAAKTEDPKPLAPAPSSGGEPPGAPERPLFYSLGGRMIDGLNHGWFGSELNPLRKANKLYRTNVGELRDWYSNLPYKGIPAALGANKPDGYYARTASRLTLSGARAADDRLLNALDPHGLASRIRAYLRIPRVPEDQRDRHFPGVTSISTAENSTADPGAEFDRFMGNHPRLAFHFGELTTIKEVVSHKLDTSRTVLGDKLRTALDAARIRGVPAYVHVDGGAVTYDEGRRATVGTTDRRYFGEAMRRLQEQGEYQLTSDQITDYNDLPPEAREQWLANKVRQQPLAVVVPHLALGKFVRMTASHLQALRDVLDDPLLAHVRFDASWTDVIEPIVDDPEMVDRVAQLLVDHPGRFVHATDMTGADNATWYSRYNSMAGPLFDKMAALAPIDPDNPEDVTHALSRFFGGTIHEIEATARERQTAWKRTLVERGAGSGLSRTQQGRLQAWAAENPGPTNREPLGPPVRAAAPASDTPYAPIDDNPELARAYAQALTANASYPANLIEQLNDSGLTRDGEPITADAVERTALQNSTLLSRAELEGLAGIPSSLEAPTWLMKGRWSPEALDAADPKKTYHRNRFSQIDVMVRTEVRVRQGAVRLWREQIDDAGSQGDFNRKRRAGLLAGAGGVTGTVAFLKAVHPALGAATTASEVIFGARAMVQLYKFGENRHFVLLADDAADGKLTVKSAEYLRDRLVRVGQRYDSFQPWRINGINAAYDPLIQALKDGSLEGADDNETKRNIARAYGDAVTNVRTAVSGYGTNFDPLSPRTTRGRRLAYATSASYLFNAASGLANPLSWYGLLFAGDNATLAVREGGYAARGATPDHVRENTRFRTLLNTVVGPTYAAAGAGLFLKALSYVHPFSAIGWGIFTLGASTSAGYGFLDEFGVRVEPKRAALAAAVIQGGILVAEASTLIWGSGSSKKLTGRPVGTVTVVPPPLVPPAHQKKGLHETHETHKLQQVVVTALAGVHERAGPSVDSRVLGTVRAGTLLKATGAVRPNHGRRFAEVEIGKGMRGWVATEYLAPHPRGAMKPDGGRFDPVLQKEKYPAVKVEPGDSIAIIAERHDVSLIETIDLNKGHIEYLDLIYPGDVIYLPKRTGKPSHVA